MFKIKNFHFDKTYLKISLYVLFVIVSAIIFEKTLGNITIIFANISTVFKIIQKVLSPFIYGLFIAYILNTSVRAIENKVFYPIPYMKSHPKQRRVFSVILTYILSLGAIFWAIGFLIPEVIESIKNLMLSLKDIEKNFSSYSSNDILSSLLHSFNETFNSNYTYTDVIDIILNPLMQGIASLPNLVNKVFISAINIAYITLEFIIGLMIAFYMLCDKESFQKLISKILMTVFKKSTAEKIIYVAKTSNTMFEKFFIGKVIDSIIIGILFFIICLFIKPPYILLLSLIIGVTNMIPYFGPFIGAIPVCTIVLLNNPIQALWIILIILILQQFDGIILGPKILGDSTGLKPLGVIFAIIVGGAFFNVLGMFLGVPIFAIIKNTVLAIIDRSYDKKYIFPNTDSRGD